MRKLYFAVLILQYALATTAQNVALDSSFAGKGYVQTGFGYHDYINTSECHQILSLPDGSCYLLFQGAPSFISHRLANGALDANYGDRGYSASRIFYTAAVLLPDGRIVLGGTNAESLEIFDFLLACYLPDGSLDKTFGVGGYQSTDFFGLNDQIKALALQPDGKIVAAGVSDSHFAIARYFPNGSIDNSFSGDGKDTIHFGGESEIAISVGIKSDGRIVIAGESGSSGQQTLLSIAYYLSNGTRDNGFSSDGKLSLLLPDGRSTTSMKLQPDGKMVFAGYCSVDGQVNVSVVRLLENGALDNTFSSEGTVTINFGTATSAMAVELDQNNKIVVGAHAPIGQYCLARLLMDGSLDNSFSEDGLVTTSLNIGSDYLRCLAIQSNGKILAGGISSTSLPNYQSKFSVARYNTDGSLDETFDGDGMLVDYKPSSATSFLASAVQPDGKLVTIGETYITQQATDVCVARYNIDGTPDNTFSGDGKLLLKFGPGRNSANGVAIQQDGKIVIGGEARPSLYYGEFAVARLNSDGSMDSSFSDDGIVVTDMGGFFDQLKAICILPNGKIVAGGNSDSVAYYNRFALARYNPDGKLDSTFSGDGKLITDVGDQLITEFGFQVNGVEKLLTQPDGKIIAVGGSTIYSANYRMDIVIARFNPDGTLDASFNGTGIKVTNIDVHTICYGAALDVSGRLLIGGFSGSGAGGQSILVRYLSNGTLDPSLSDDGLATWSNSSLMLSIAIDATGKIITGGVESLGYNENAVVMRLNPDGTPDNTFAAGGKIITDLGDDEIVSSINVFNNRIYAVGTSSFDGSTGLVIAYSPKEICNFKDDDGDGEVDEGCRVYYLDADGDGYGLWHIQTRAMSQPPGYSSIGGDCDDGNPAIHPGAIEACNFRDDNCNGHVDEGCQLFYRDADGDGYGLWHVQTRAITRPAGYSTIGGDCDDANPNIHPGAMELCNGINDDCDGLTDEGCPGSIANMRAEQKEAINLVDLSITAYPNPTNKIFSVRVEGDRKQGKVILRITNNLGELKEIRNSLEVGQTINIGDGYPPGMYFIEATQGKNKKVIKVVKS